MGGGERSQRPAAVNDMDSGGPPSGDFDDDIPF
jgi:hypothetical protein